MSNRKTALGQALSQHHVDERFLNVSQNKTARTNQPIRFVVIHETASPNPGNPFGTLEYNLPRYVGASYHYLIARDGTIFPYIDENEYIAWHAGVYSVEPGPNGEIVTPAVYMLDDQPLYPNDTSIGVELDGRNDGTPITEEQKVALIDMMIFFERRYGIPLERPYYVEHKELTKPGYKSDPRGMDIDIALEFARDLADVYRMRNAMLVPDGKFAVDDRFLDAWERSGGVWRANELTPGYADSPAYQKNGQWHQRFERGIARQRDDGAIEWLLLPEIKKTRFRKGTS